MRKTFVTLLLAACTIAGICLTAPQASAQTLGTCPLGTTQVTYTPGITAEPSEVFQEGSESSGLCVFVLPVGLASFTTAFSGELVTSCTELLTGEDSGSQTFFWNNGQESYWEFTSITSQNASGNTVATYRGTLSPESERFPGAFVVQVVTYLNLTLDDCLNSALTEQSGTSTYTFTIGV
jgi:hypothetical protein